MSVTYPFETSPELGHTQEVLPGLLWLRMPLPFLLGHINLWLLRDGEGWTVVDSGLFTEKSRNTWAAVFSKDMNDLPIERIMVTHLHPDHTGCVGWLADQFDAQLLMTRAEYFLCRILVADTGKPAPQEGRQYYQSAGYAQDQLDRYEEMFGAFGRMVAPLPESYLRLTDGMQVNVGGRQWSVIEGRGHSPEHACFFCEADNVLISGDQILPTISSNISVFPTEPLANPLDDWLISLAELKLRLPADVLVLPSHGKPFTGAHERLDQLIAEHLDGLDKLRILCAKPHRAVDVFPALFKSTINDNNMMMATGEAIAHLNYLLHQGELSTTVDDEGVTWYQR